MLLLNDLSIKSKLLCVVFVPFSILIMVSLWEIGTLQNDIANLSSIEANLSAGDKVITHLLVADRLRLNKLKQKTEKYDQVLLDQALQNSQKVKSLSDSLVTRASDKIKNKILQSFTSSFNDMNEAFIDVDDFDKVDIDEWSSWVIEDISFELFNSLEKLIVHTSIDEVNQKMHVVNQLRWIMFYALQENWLIEVMLERQSFDKLEQLRTVIVKEEIFIGRFLSLNANEQQIELLLKTFQEEDFQKSLAYKESLLANNLDFFTLQEKGYVESVLKNRLTLIMKMSQNIISNTNEEIKSSIYTVKKDIYRLMIAIVLLILLVIMLAFNLINRIFSYLKSTIKQLEKIESENDYSIQISESGKDEFSHFSSKLNLLIAERKISVGKMLQSKEDAEKANKAKSYFLANMSHEIRTPLNGIIGMYQILSSTDLSHSQKNHLEIIHQSSKTLLILINDILDISKIESGKLIISVNNTQLRESLYETVSMVSAKAVEKKLKLSVYIDPKLPVFLILDEYRLRQIVMNLLSNSLKFTALGTVELIVSGELTADSRCTLTIQVKDTGIGIAKDSQKNIFKPFVQEDGSITREYGGTGLGLAISAQLVKLMGGQLDCHSEKGKGSCFYFNITVDIAQKKEPLSMTEKHQIMLIDTDGRKAEILKREFTFLGVDVVQTVSELTALPSELATSTALLYCQSTLSNTEESLAILSTKYAHNPLLIVQETNDENVDFKGEIAGQIMIPLLGKRCLSIINTAIEEQSIHEPHNTEIQPISASQYLPILLVEDNLVNQKVAGFFLTSFGYEFEVASNGLMAVQLIKQGKYFSTILMDCMMPIMDGFTATEEIRLFEKQNGLNKTPIIALTASIFDEDIKHCYAVGMDDYLAKPIDKDMFEQKMKEYMPLSR